MLHAPPAGAAVNCRDLLQATHCIGDIIQTLQEMQSAHGYRHPEGSMDANGMMLRTNADILGVTASDGSLKPANVRCSGARP